MSGFKTTQEEFWAGDFGTEYSLRNSGEVLHASNLAFWSRALRSTQGLKSGLELGANIGMNVKALKTLIPRVDLSAVEINGTAVEELKKILPPNEITHGSILDFNPNGRRWDLVYTKGVLIHLSPEHLSRVYEAMYQLSNRYIFVAEYYNPVPVEILYRGHEGKLFKRDFAGELLSMFDDLRLVDYGFSYRNDRNFPQDDITWFLLEK